MNGDDAGEILEVDSMEDAGAGRDNGDVSEGRIRPFKELEPFAVLLEFVRARFLKLRSPVGESLMERADVVLNGETRVVVGDGTPRFDNLDRRWV